MNSTTRNNAAARTASGGDARLVKDCLAGNEQAWAKLIDKYKALIYSIPVKYGLPPQDAADVFQTTCLELLTRLGELREVRALPKWLIQVTHHQCWQWKQRDRRLVSRDSEPDPVEPEVPPVAETLLRQTQEEQMLREAVSGLSPQCRRLVETLFFEDEARPYNEIAAELGVAVGSIGFIRQKCLERLRRRLKELGFA
ncbi:MAG TPA: sigma-70 family RNA polymerase sigma factor [Candidatus Acidoferrales bacterium]|nr:sigma-70 family RNA polymerase sigma factor [Candidatus Acidoferrales bacterium]